MIWCYAGWSTWSRQQRPERPAELTNQLTYITLSFFPTRLHLLWCQRPGLLRPLSLGLFKEVRPGPGDDLSLPLGPGLDRPSLEFDRLQAGLPLGPPVQWDGLVQPGLNQPVLSFACGELSRSKYIRDGDGLWVWKVTHNFNNYIANNIQILALVMVSC